MTLVDVRREGAMWVLVLNRPERRNALNPQLQSDLIAALYEFDRADAARRRAAHRRRPRQPR